MQRRKKVFLSENLGSPRKCHILHKENIWLCNFFLSSLPAVTFYVNLSVCTVYCKANLYQSNSFWHPGILLVKKKKSLAKENGQKFFTLFWLSGTASNSLAGVSFEVKNSPGENDLILLVKCLQHFKPDYSACLIPLELVSWRILVVYLAKTVDCPSRLNFSFSSKLVSFWDIRLKFKMRVP